MLGNDAEMQIVAYMLDKGHTFDYIFSLDIYEKMLVLGAMDAQLEMEAKKWQLEKR